MRILDIIYMTYPAMHVQCEDIISPLAVAMIQASCALSGDF